MKSYVNPVPWSPRDYQKKAVEFLVSRRSAALFLDPGLGKTSITLKAIDVLTKAGRCNRALILAPLNVCYNVWPLEAERWTDFRHLRVLNAHEAKLPSVVSVNPARLVVANYHFLPRLVSGVSGPSAFRRKYGFDTLVVDELTAFKHTSSARFKLLCKLLPTFDTRYGLTGSPAANRIEDLFGQCFILDDGAALGRYITKFRSTYFTPERIPGARKVRGAYAKRWKLKGEHAEQAIYKKLRPLALRMAAEDYLDMPELLTVDIPVTMPRGAWSVYASMYRNLIALVNDEEVTAASKAAALMKCQQVTSGAIYDDDKLVQHIHDAKLDALRALVDELQGEPVLVAVAFRHEIDRLRKEYPDAPVVAGSTAATDTRDVVERWNRGEVPVLIAHPLSAGHGLNLQGASGRHICWFSLTYDYEIYDQCIRRLYRQGTKAESIIVHRLIADATVDERIASVLESKAGGQEAMFAALKED